MKKFRVLALLLAVLSIVGIFAGCTTEEQSGEKDLLATIKERGKIIVAMEGTWAPWTYHDEAGTLTGYDVEVAQLIAKHIGVEVEFVEGSWDGLLSGLESGRYDIMANGVDITDDRKEKYDFSTPYAYNRTAVIVAADDESITEMADLEGKQTANTISSTYAAVAEKYGATVTGVDDLNQTFEMLLSGRIDATLNAEVTFHDYMGEHPETAIKIACLDPDATQVAIPVTRTLDNASLVAAINEALEAARADGSLSALSEKYFGVDISKE